MRWTETLIPTLREAPKEAEAGSHKWLLRGGFIRQLASGVYSYLPLGQRVLQKVSQIIREEMSRAGAAEVLLPALHPAELWKKTGRYEALGGDKIAFQSRSGQEFVLGPTHEEVITELAAGSLKSYQDLPLILFQIQTKFRDELRPRFGIIRTREFIMKDAYSFDRDEAGLEVSYQKMLKAYERIFNRCGIRTQAVAADPGLMGGKGSQEFMVESPYGEDRVAQCKKCRTLASLEIAGEPPDLKTGKRCLQCGETMKIITTMEVGHIFKLGTRYSEPLGAGFVDESGQRRTAVMGCYGIGVNRTMAAIVEENQDEKGICWPPAVAPFKIELVTVNESDAGTREAARKLYDEWTHQGIEVLYDNRNERAGVKFNDADLLGIPLQVILGERNLKNGEADLKSRRDGKCRLVKLDEVSRQINAFFSKD